MAEQPDPSELPIYECEDALRFACQWTGLPQDLVQSILHAKSRYLELTGIMDLGEDPEGLAREREIYAHLLPEVPGTLGERMLDYIAEVTAAPRAAIEFVDRAEFAYQDSLGLVEWDDEEERSATLGVPAPPREPGRAATIDAAEAPMHEGHGDHWACVVENLDAFVQEDLRPMPGPEHLLFSVPSRTPRWEFVTARSLPGGTALTGWRLDGARGDSEEIITAYPVALDGISHPLTLHRARVWEADCEAIVEAATAFGAPLAYFDTAFLHPWNEWGPDEQVRVQLAAFAYTLEPAPDQVIQITREDTIRAMRSSSEGIAPEDVTDLSPLDVQTLGLACLIATGRGNPDEFEFQGPVLAADVLEAFARTFYRLEVNVLRDTRGEEDIPFSIPIYVAADVLPAGYRPRPGDHVRGVLWLQGRPEGLRFPIISAD